MSLYIYINISTPYSPRCRGTGNDHGNGTLSQGSKLHRKAVLQRVDAKGNANRSKPFRTVFQAFLTSETWKNLVMTNSGTSKQGLATTPLEREGLATQPHNNPTLGCPVRESSVWKANRTSNVQTCGKTVQDSQRSNKSQKLLQRTLKDTAVPECTMA